MLRNAQGGDGQQSLGDSKYVANLLVLFSSFPNSNLSLSFQILEFSWITTCNDKSSWNSGEKWMVVVYEMCGDVS